MVLQQNIITLEDVSIVLKNGNFRHVLKEASRPTLLQNWTFGKTRYFKSVL